MKKSRTKYPPQRIHYAGSRERLYFLDTEFMANGEGIDLISIALVCGDGREYYACNSAARLDQVDDWVRANVLPSLPSYSDPHWKSPISIRTEIAAFIRSWSPRPEIWAYYSSYDWVALCELYGRMVDLPGHFPMHCMDLKQLSVMLGSPRHPADPKDEHNALADARWNKKLYEGLQRYKQPR